MGRTLLNVYFVILILIHVVTDIVLSNDGVQFNSLKILLIKIYSVLVWISTGEGRKEPVGINFRTGRGGLGAEADRKRRKENWTAMRASRQIKRQKMESNLKRDFQQRMSSKFTDGKAERDVIKSQKVCEHLDSEMVR